ncbi:hypothetical protein E3N88_17623 [Mikania micrantha]|uniref:Transmembrane protein n=1 Tax=Mikania micrantha TaxID=192012 RepID=A0A5N6NVE8_9ASTR|nr:hypothetical protein E3N88_17623 [Mikania micrantha]
MELRPETQNPIRDLWSSQRVVQNHQQKHETNASSSSSCVSVIFTLTVCSDSLTRDTGDAMLVNLFVLALSALYLIISLVFLVATVSSSSEAYTTKVQNFTEVIINLVVSVLEDTSGLGAIFRARELMKGEKVKTSLLVVLFYVAYGVIYWMTSAIVSQNLEQWSQMVISIAITNGLLCALKLFSFVVFTIFYHEQKESCDEKVAKTIYLPVAGDEV